MKIIYIVFILIILSILGYIINNTMRKEKHTQYNEYNWLYNYFDKIYTITLPERINNVLHFSEILNFKPQIFQAILKKNLNKQDLINNGVVSKSCGLTMGEIACYLSHLAVLEKFLNDENAKTCLIFEDDVQIPKNVEQIKKKINHAMKTIPDDWDMINFGRGWDNCSKENKVNDTIVKSYGLNLHSYAVTKEGARKILENCKIIGVYAIDEMLKNLSSENKINMYATEKRVFEQNRDNFNSTLSFLRFKRDPECSWF